jgi:glycosyltransferase involved in cell wall biosynthesis/O-antigen/teichoic acid export membrane protein
VIGTRFRETPSPLRADTHTRLVRGAGWLTLAAVLVGALNYGYSTSLTWLLPAHAYSVFVSGQVMLTVCGTIAGAWLPWLIAQGIAESPENAVGRRASISFAALVGCLQGLVAGVVVFLVAGQFSSRPTQLLLSVSAGLIFLSTISFGYLQGLERFSLLASFLVGEVTVKVAVGLSFVLGGVGVFGALAGFGLSSLGVISAGVVVMRGDLRWCGALLRRRDLWRRAGWLLCIQTSIVVFVNLDVLLAGVLVEPGADLARYQVSTILGRIPLPLTLALATAVFPELSASQARSRPGLRASARFFLRTTVPVALVIATMPQAVIDLLFPSSYGGISALLPITATTGVLLSAAYLTVIVYLAGRRFRTATRLLAIGLALHATAVVAGLKLAGIRGLALGAAVGGAGMLALLLFKGRRSLSEVGRPLDMTAVAAATATVLLLLRPFPVAWCMAAGLVLLAFAWRVIQPGRADEETVQRPPALAGEGRFSSGESKPLRILHLAFDDHRLPGSGGQSVRTFEVNRRLAQRHQVTVVTMNYKGAGPRVEQGVRYIQAGLPWGYFGRMISYLLCLPLAVWRHPSDLVVEDFAPPISSVLVPLWTRRPVVGMVQWLFADQKSRQYKLPFFLLERWGVRAHRRLIAVSSAIGTRLQTLNPSAHVAVIPNGVEQQHIIPRDDPDQGSLVFLGRIELDHKGLDLLLRAFAEIAPSVQTNLVIAGDGRDQERVRRLVDEMDLRDRVRMVGRVAGAAKSELLARARLVCVTSRYEVFPLVPLEAQAAGTPVLAFAITAMGEVLAPDGGVLVPPFDVGAYAQAMLRLLNAPEQCRAMGEAGRQFVRRFHWDAVASQQERVYLEAVSARSSKM